MTNQTLRQQVEQLFGLPAMKMSWSLYLAQLNEAGKLTTRSIMDIMTIVLTVSEEQEEKIQDLELLSHHVPETTGEILDAIKPEEPKLEPTLEEKVSEVAEKIVDKGLVDAILTGRPPEPQA